MTPTASEGLINFFVFFLCTFKFFSYLCTQRAFSEEINYNSKLITIMKQRLIQRTLFFVLAMLAGTGNLWADTTNKLVLNGSESSNPAGYFSHDTSGKFNFNSKYNGVTYDGVTFTSGLKMEGSTVVTFSTTAASSIVTIVQSTWSANTIKFDGAELSVSDATAGTGYREYKINSVAAGDHTISRGSGESGLLYVSVVEAGGSGGSSSTVSGTFYSASATAALSVPASTDNL